MAALDAQSNWDIEMNKSQKIISDSLRRKEAASKPLPPYLFSDPSQFSHEGTLPPEIVSQIISFVPHRASSQSTLWACTLVNRTWYSAGIASLYQRPYLTGGNFAEFVPTVCPSKNAHIRQSALAVLVRKLDMGELVHNASKSLTARLLGRLKGNLEEFVAPQASFAINSFAALSKCTKLTYLDLSLISASISNQMLFKTLKSLQDLETLFFPRSSSLDPNREPTPYEWPPHLKALHLAGGIDDHFLVVHLTNAPSTLSRLSIQHCANTHAFSVIQTCAKLGSQLQHLTIRHPMPHLYAGSLDSVFELCKSLIALRISADFITNKLFEFIPSGHPLQILDLECSPQAGADIDIQAQSVLTAVETGLLPDLRSVRASMRLAWSATESTRAAAEDLSDALEDAESDRPLGVSTGVWVNIPDT